MNGNSLTKIAATRWGNAGASSTQSIVSGDGYVEVTATDLSGSVYVCESGNNRGNFGPYVNGDKLQVAIVGGVVKYKKNGTVFYTSSIAPPTRSSSTPHFMAMAARSQTLCLVPRQH